jgi:TonB-dependent starch-binding outer membrane protein SusC
MVCKALYQPGASPSVSEPTRAWRRDLTKTLLVMKLTGILILAAAIHVSARSVAQTVTYEAKKAPLSQVFAAIKEQTGYVFFYSPEDLEGTVPVSVKLRQAPLKDALESILADQPLAFTIQGNTIAITRKASVVADTGKRSADLPGGDVHGRVTDSSGHPLADASVFVKGSRKGASTDAQGNFELKSVDSKASIIVSYTGFESQEIRLNGKYDIVIQLKQGVAQLLDVVVNKGYYNTTNRLNTGDVATVKSEDIENQPITNPILAMEGLVPGLYVQPQSGVPGGNISVLQIRGVNSIQNGTNPLILVDGVPFPSTSLSANLNIYGAASALSPFNTLSNSDIESIEVLKDADATAIYGTRGANGVILITTKKGKTGQTVLNVNVNEGVGSVTKIPKFMNTQQYLTMRNEAFQNDGVSPGASDYDVNGTWDTTRYTNWGKVFIGNKAHTTNAQASLTGGNATTQFAISAGYVKQTTVFPGSFYDGLGSVHLNLNHSSTNNRLQLSLKAEYSNDHNFMPSSDPTSQMAYLAPDAPSLYLPNGQLNWENSSWYNPEALLLQTSEASTNTLNSSLNISYELLKGLYIKSLLGYSDIRLSVYNLSPYAASNPTFATIYSRSSTYGNSETNAFIAEPQINYTLKYGRNTLELLVGTTFQSSTTNSLGIYGNGFTSDALMKNIALASVQGVNLLSNTQYRLNKLYARIGYNFDQKYLANLTASREGSSRFGPNEQFGNFGALGVGYIFTKEKAVQEFLPFLSFGKLRASYGTTGNDQIGDYQYLSTYSGYNVTYQGLTGLTPTSLTNPYYSWERVDKFETGIDLGFIKDRLSLTGSYYRNKTSNQLVGYTVPMITGFSSVEKNLAADVQNTGFEFTIESKNIQSKNLQWVTEFNLSIPRNKLVSFQNFANSNYANTYAIGYSLGVRHLLKFTGLNPQTGQYTFYDYDHDGQITYPNDYQDLVDIKYSYFGGLMNKISYKKIELDFLFQFVKKNALNIYSSLGLPGTINSNQPVDVLNRWQKAGDNASYEMYSQNYGSAAGTAYFNKLSSDAVVSDASFIRLRNLSLGYRFQGKGQKGLKNCKVYIQAQNLFVISKFPDMDPETQSLSSLPPLKMFTGGIQITL